MNKKNVLLISQSLSIGGAEKVISDLSLELDKEFNVFILTYSKSDVEYMYAGSRYNINCPGGTVSIINKVKNFLIRLYRVKKYKKERNIDISISFVPQTDYINIFTRKKGEKVVIEVSSNMSIAFKNKISKEIRKFILKHADHVVAVSRGTMHDLEINFNIERCKLSAIYNSCDIQKIKSLYKNTNDKSDVIVSAGSFRKPKGHWHLIKAFSLISSKYPNVKLQILGEGDYKERYKKLINNLNMDSKMVDFPGFQSNPYRFISKAKIFVLSSIYEGFGNVIIESMACGTPVISTDCDYGPREILAPKTEITNKTECIELAEYGCLVPHMGDYDIDITNRITKEEKILASALDLYLSDELLRENYIIKGYKRSKEFDIKDFGNQWKTLIMKLIEE